MQASFEGLWLHPVFRQRGKGKLAEAPDRPLPSRQSGLEKGSGAAGTGDGYKEPVFSEGRVFPPPGGKAGCRTIHASLPRPGKYACVLRDTQRLLPSGPASNGQEAPRAGSGGKEQARQEPHLLTLFLPSTS